MAQEEGYNCPKCNQEVHAVGLLRGAVCLACNGVSTWQPTLIKTGIAMRKESNPENIIAVATTILKDAGIYEQFMRLYGQHLMHTIMKQNQHKSHNNSSSNSSNSSKSHKSQNSNNPKGNTEKEQEQKDDIKQNDEIIPVISFDGKLNQLSFNNKSYEAYNKPDSTSNGPFPNGTFSFEHFVRHDLSKENKKSKDYNAYGNIGNVVFKVSGRTGMGIHAGREDKANGKPTWWTKGCIRTSESTMEALVMFIGLHNYKQMGNGKITTNVVKGLILKVRNNENNINEWQRKQ
eukprot:97809_1